MRRSIQFIFFFISGINVSAQVKWQNVDSLYQPLPASVHVYFTDSPIDTAPFRAYYLIADLKDKRLDFTVDTTRDRRITPSAFYERNDKPLVVVNCTFFSYETNRSLNAVVKNSMILVPNPESVPLKGKDTLKYFHTLSSAIGFTGKGNADVAWLLTKRSGKKCYASPWPVSWIDSVSFIRKDSVDYYTKYIIGHVGEASSLSRWKMKTAVGGGPVLMSDGEIHITNNEERKFSGKAINDKHPRTVMGYTQDGKLIILMIEGRNNIAHGATLTQEAQILKDLGCWEALNLDGGGSSCLLVNGKPTIKVSDAAGQRPVPAVFIIRSK